MSIVEKLDTSKKEGITITLKINGKDYKVEIQPTETLISVLRDRLHLTGTKYGCGEGECGACSIIMNGKLVNSCLILAAQADKADILTIEGYENDELIRKLQESFIEKGAVQCGYCTPGMIMAGRALLGEKPDASTDEIREAISGNLCRCTGYVKIVEAIDNVKES
jgi:carbon-monoxide dehydrogenase small subunit